MAESRTARAATARARGRHAPLPRVPGRLAPGSDRSVTVVNDLGQTLVPLLIAAPALIVAGPTLGRSAAHLVVPAGGRGRQLGSRSGRLDLVRGGARRARALPRAARTSATSVPCRSCSPACLAFPSQVLAEHGPRSSGARRPHHDRRPGLRQLRHLPRRGVHVQRGRAARADHRCHLPGRRRRHRRRGGRGARPSQRSPGGTPSARGGGCGVVGGGGQRLRLHDRDGYVRKRPRHRCRLAARLRAARAGGVHDGRACRRRRSATHLRVAAGRRPAVPADGAVHRLFLSRSTSGAGIGPVPGRRRAASSRCSSSHVRS